MEFPHLCGCVTITHPSSLLDPAPVQSQHFQQEWKANPKGMATTYTDREPHPHQHPEWHHQEKASQHEGAAGESPECAKHPDHTMVALHRAGGLFSSLPQALLAFTKPTLSPKNQQKGTGQAQLCSPRSQLPFPPAQGPGMEQSWALQASTERLWGKGRSSHPAAALSALRSCHRQ